MESRPSPSVILLDIEGTTTSISFVKEVLFPYAAEHVEQFLRDYWDDSEVQGIVKDLRKECENDIGNGVPGVEKILDDGTPDIGKVQESVVANILWQMKQDMKRTPLKALQGKIWKHGFEAGDLLGHVFDDVPSAFQRFHDNQQKICIYSSGSVQAQKLLFKYSTAGDLSRFISDYFDTNVGSKVESQSYTNIAKNLEVDPKNILFFTDVPNEGSAAREASLDVVLMVRPGNVPLTSEHTQAFTVANNFKELELI